MDGLGRAGFGENCSSDESRFFFRGFEANDRRFSAVRIALTALAKNTLGKADSLFAVVYFQGHVNAWPDDN
jgi:hypothetical protein